MGSQSSSSVPPELSSGPQQLPPGYRQTPTTGSGSVGHADQVDFRDRADAAAKLAPLVADAVGTAVADSLKPVTVVAKYPGGTIIGEAVAAALDSTLLQLPSAADVATLPLHSPAAHLVIVVDDGVETGRAAVGIGQAFRERKVGGLWLAVPVSPRQSEVVLDRVYDKVIAVVRPLARRSLRWHYREF